MNYFYLLFSFIGAVLIVFSIFSIKKNMFDVPVVLKMRLADNIKYFEIKKSGIYSIWQETWEIGKSPLLLKIPVITNTYTKENIELKHSLVNMHKKGIKKAQKLVFTFYATEGSYMINFEDGNSFGETAYKLSSIVPLDFIDKDNVNIVITEKVSFIKFFFSVLGCVAGMWLIMIGIFFTIGVQFK